MSFSGLVSLISISDGLRYDAGMEVTFKGKSSALISGKGGWTLARDLSRCSWASWAISCHVLEAMLI
jgi:hypothetical protein